VNTEVQRFMDVTPADIERVARTYFVATNMTRIEIDPKAGQGR
jgi:predicted Zn-dependent peptidase